MGLKYFTQLGEEMESENFKTLWCQWAIEGKHDIAHIIQTTRQWKDVKEETSLQQELSSFFETECCIYHLKMKAKLVV